MCEDRKEDGYDMEDKAKSPGPMAGTAPGHVDWADGERRTLALVKACEVSNAEDDDFSIIARAGRFLNFLREGK